MHVGGTGSSEETEDALTRGHGVDGVVSALIHLWERRSFERFEENRLAYIDQRHNDDHNDTTAIQQFKQSFTDKRLLLAAPALASPAIAKAQASAIATTTTTTTSDDDDNDSTRRNMQIGN